LTSIRSRTSTDHFIHRMKQGKHELVPVADIVLDKSNPRIKLWLEMYAGEPTAEQIQLALGAGADDKDTQAGTTFNKLKNSILTNGGIIQPIILNILPNGKRICIEGNTRVCLYKLFSDQKIPGTWSKIPAIVYTNLADEETDAIRLQAHLVGPRQWDPYSKAKYLTYLRTKEHFPFSKLVDYCGGSQKAVMESIDAYADMEMHYRPLCDSEGDFDPRRFSGFVELQKNQVKTAISQSGFEIADFAKWIYEKKIDPLATVRWLPRILKNKKATQIFLKKGATAAIKVLDRPDLNKALQEATLAQLAQALAEAINKISFAEVQALQNDPTSDTNQALLESQDALNTFMLNIQPNE
jgi:hypothetical protein